MSGVRGRAVAFSLTDDDLRPSILVTVDITLLYFNDCPNWLIANDHLETLVVEHPEIVITRHIVDTAEEAAHTGFRGSPSILVDGHDPFAGPGDLVGLSCRIYQTPEGPAGSPTPDQLRQVVARSD